VQSGAQDDRVTAKYQAVVREIRCLRTEVHLPKFPEVIHRVRSDEPDNLALAIHSAANKSDASEHQVPKYREEAHQARWDVQDVLATAKCRGAGHRARLGAPANRERRTLDLPGRRQPA
jgi:hypothetical protein